MMKKLITVLLVLISYSVMAQPYDCDPDTAAPTFEMPYYLADTVYPSLEDVPILWGPPYPDVMDIVFETLQDDCLSAEWPPWYGPTLTSWYGALTDTSITYEFTANDDQPNYSYGSITFYWGRIDGIEEYTIKSLKVYPNPNNGIFSVNMIHTIHDVNGRQVQQPLNSGMYIVTAGHKHVRVIVR